MDLTFRTLGPWGPGKGANLTPPEVDGNFYAVAQAIVDLQNNPALPNSIASITVSGTTMTIHMMDGSTMGPFDLPVLTFRWRGEWQPSTSYAELDVFTVTDVGIFLVNAPHTSGTEFDPELMVGALPAYIQLFGSTDARLSGLSDVLIDSLNDADFLSWDATISKWVNGQLGTIAFQNYWAVDIQGGTITGMSIPLNPTDVATKAYVDALPLGMTTLDSTMMSNISGLTAPAIPNTLSDFLDHVLLTTTRGAILFRAGGGWQALPPGSNGQFLMTLGPGADLAWMPGGSGVTSITAGTGLTTGGSPIMLTGTISLAAIADKNFLANTSGTSAAPVPTTLTAFLDSALTNARGTLLARDSTGWVPLAPGTNGYFLKTQGTGADLIWASPAGSGTVTSISAGSGITTGGSPITGAGTVSLAAAANLTLLANISGSAAAPLPTTVSLLFDAAISPTQGAVLYRSATGWVALSPGTSGQFLATGGAAANPSWQNAPITGASTPNLRIVSNISGSTAVPIGNTLTNLLDATVSSSRGTMLFRTNSGWVGLAPGTAGQVLQTGGASSDPSWITNGGGGIVVTSPHAQDTLSYNTSSGKFENVRPRYNVGAYVLGTMTGANQNLLFHRFSKAVTLPANLGAYLGHASEAGGATPATGSTVITLARAVAATPTTFATIATVTIAAGSVNGTFSVQGAISCAQGDVLRIRGPAAPDATFSDFHLTLVGYET
jgi:hypothetical protein